MTGGLGMAEHDAIDFSKLMGFETVREFISGDVDFRDDVLGAKIGAKVGDNEASPSRESE
jgi:hypothetical protein